MSQRNKVVAGDVLLAGDMVTVGDVVTTVDVVRVDTGYRVVVLIEMKHLYHKKLIVL